MPVSADELVTFIEEQNARLHQRKKPETYREWRTRITREAHERRQKANLEAEMKEKKIKKRVYSLIYQYFRPELGTEGEIVEWNHKLKGRGFSRVSVKKAVEAMNLQNDSNIFFTVPNLDMTDEELLLILSQNLADKTYHVDVERKGGRFTLPLKMKRMEKD